MPPSQHPADGATPVRLTLVLDRIEGTTAAFVDDGGGEIAVPLGRLPGGGRWAEGSVVRVPLSASGLPRWDAAELDQAETDRRRAGAAAVLDELKKRDPGGDARL